MVSCLLFIFLFSLCLLGSSLGLQFVPVSNPNIQFIGRYDYTVSSNVTYDWPGFHSFGVFNGTTFQVVAQNINTGTYSYHNVIIDGQSVGFMNVSGTKETFSFEQLKNEEHTFLIAQRGDADYGPTAIYGFNIDDDATLLPPPPRFTRRLEIIGDSITVGGAMLGPCNVTVPVHSDQDNTLTYGVLTANNVSAEYFVEAVSGIGITYSHGRPAGMPQYYSRMQLEQPTPLWNFKQWIPDAVTIHLGTNDIFTAENASTVWIDTYVDFVEFIRAQYAPAKPEFFILCGSTFNSPWCPYAAKVASLVGGTFIDLSDTVTSADIGCVGHPNEIGHQKMAAGVIPVIKSVMKW